MPNKRKQQRDIDKERHERHERFAEILDKLIKSGWTQKRVAHALGMHQPRLSIIKNGARPTNEQLGLLMALAMREGLM